MMANLSHFDDAGASRMVDIGGKVESERVARASAIVKMLPETLALVRDRKLAKGDVFEVARLAGIMAAKKPLILSRFAILSLSLLLMSNLLSAMPNPYELPPS